MKKIVLGNETYLARDTEYQVAGVKYIICFDSGQTKYYAVNLENGDYKKIARCHKDLTVRKAIANAFKLNTFRK